MGHILNDSKAKYKTNKTLLQTLIDNSPLSDHAFSEICEAYETDETEAMDLMINCESGEFLRLDSGWEFVDNES